MVTVFTVGHSTRSGEEFVEILKAHRVEVLVDVRSFPGSRRYPQFNRAALSESLEKAGIDWKLYDENKHFLCTIIIAHGKKTKEEVVAYSVQKTERAFKVRGLAWPPRKK